MPESDVEQNRPPRIIQRPVFWLKLTELILGKICFILASLYGKIIILCSPGNISDRECIIRHNLYIVAAVAYTFIIQNVVLLNYIRHRKAYESTFVDPLFTLIGFVVYVSVGGIQLFYGIYSEKNKQIAISVMFLIIGAIYLVDFLHCIITKFRDKSLFFQRK